MNKNCLHQQFGKMADIVLKSKTVHQLNFCAKQNVGVPLFRSV